MSSRLGALKNMDNSTEHLILTGMIVSTEFLREIYHALDIQYFQSAHVRMVAEWVIDYAKENDGNSPGAYIQEVFDIEQRNTEVADAEVIETLLTKISKEYENKDFNVVAFRSKAFDYFQERSLIILAEDILWNLNKKGVNEAEEVLTDYKKVSGNILTGKWATDNDAFDSWWLHNADTLFTFPGVLGRYLPTIRRAKLYAYLAPTKRGKSWWLLETALMAAMNRCNTIFFSLEMDANEVHERFHKRISGREKLDEKSKDYMIPVFDCSFNQNGECEANNCPSPGVSLLDEGSLPEFSENIGWEVCTACRSGENADQYSIATWFDVENRKAMKRKTGRTVNQMFEDHYGAKTFHMANWPIGSKSVEDLDAYMNRLEYSFGWVPEVIVIDYADILKKGGQKEKRHQLSDIWEQLAALAKRRNAAVFTASQGNRGSINKPRLEAGDLAEDISKAMIVDCLIAINEDNTDTEKIKNDDMWQRQFLEVLLLRYGKQRNFLQCATLNNFSIGQVCFDSEIKR